MKNFSWCACALALALVFSETAGKLSAQPPSPAADRHPILLELFTSEGCSSCPSADLLLQKLEAQQPVGGVQIIVLEEHVDYWNHDGWIDPFSSAEWTQRQLGYSTIFKNDSYTPELVIDGLTNLVGNNPKAVVTEIQKAAAFMKTELTIKSIDADSKKAHRFEVAAGKLSEVDPKDSAEVWLAVTEDGLHSAVSRGENAGHELSHVATLRSLRKIGVADANSATSFTSSPEVKFDSKWDPKKIRVTVFLQEKKSRKVIGIAQTGAQS
jgi:hypothetical protein